MRGKALVVDANILVRGVLGKRVRDVIETYCEEVSFFVPEAVYAEAEVSIDGKRYLDGGPMGALPPPSSHGSGNKA
jgi:hypothetical protein